MIGGPGHGFDGHPITAIVGIVTTRRTVAQRLFGAGSCGSPTGRPHVVSMPRGSYRIESAIGHLEGFHRRVGGGACG